MNSTNATLVVCCCVKQSRYNNVGQSCCTCIHSFLPSFIRMKEWKKMRVKERIYIYIYICQPKYALSAVHKKAQLIKTIKYKIRDS